MGARRQPVIVGVGQVVNRTDDPHALLEPLEMMARAAERAAADAEAPRCLAEVDSITVVNVICWSYGDAPGALAARLGARPAETVYTSVGGNSPQWRVNVTADRIARGEVRLALIAGAEAMHALRIARKHGVDLPWTPPAQPKAMVGDTRMGSNEVELRHHARMPTRIYPLFENALRAHRGWDLERHRRFLAEFAARFAAIARDNPYAWFRDGKTATEIGTVTPANRMIAFPYPKFMNAIMDVDQAAALLLTDTETARTLAIPEEKWVYLWAGADGHDHWYVSDRVNYWSSPAIRLLTEEALTRQDVSVEGIRFFDFYSCFPCAPQITAEMLGLRLDDPRPFTVTGGLPYHGGPGNNYVTHAIATMVERLRTEPGSLGLVTGIGWYLTKHAVGLYASAPPPRPWARPDPAAIQARLDAEPHPELVIEAQGRASVETYTVVHDRDGAPEVGILVLRLADGRRCWANVTDGDVLDAMEREEFIGRPGRVRFHEPTGVNVFEP